MKFEFFKAGRWQTRYRYKSFEPVPVNHDWAWEEPSINTLLEQATLALGELNAFSLIVSDIDLFIEMHVVKEAQSSSKIEGTVFSQWHRPDRHQGTGSVPEDIGLANRGGADCHGDGQAGRNGATGTEFPLSQADYRGQ